MYHDAVTGEEHVPLQKLSRATASFEIRNSPLSEYACVGFELGYNLQEPGRLVLWEAQHGDFINGAQIILDEHDVRPREVGHGAVTGAAAAARLRGQGPDHRVRVSSDFSTPPPTPTCASPTARRRRSTSMCCADRRCCWTDPLPLVVMTPKSLLRHPFTASRRPSWPTASSCASSTIQKRRGTGGEGQTLVLCSGKVAVDLFTSERRKDNPHVAIVRVEQLYPFPSDVIRDLLDRYSSVREVCWVQEEPENMGAWEFARPELEAILDGRWPLRYIGRSRNSSPSEGSSSWHAANQRAIVDQVFEAKAESREMDRVLRNRFNHRTASVVAAAVASHVMSTNIVVPELGESVVEARVAKWLKKQGDSVNAGDPLVELETEKIDSGSERRSGGRPVGHQAPRRV